MHSYINTILPEIILVTLITVAWLWFTCGPMVKSDTSKWERLEQQIVFCSLVIGLSSLAISQIGIKDTVVEKFIVDNIINFKLTPMVVVNIFLCITGVTAVALSQSPNKKTAKLASIFGLIGQPAWYALGVLTGSVGLLILSTLYTQAWWKGFSENWLKPWQEARRRKVSSADDFFRYTWKGVNPPNFTVLELGTQWLNLTDGHLYVWAGSDDGWRRVTPALESK